MRSGKLRSTTFWKLGLDDFPFVIFGLQLVFDVVHHALTELGGVEVSSATATITTATIATAASAATAATAYRRHHRYFRRYPAPAGLLPSPER